MAFSLPSFNTTVNLWRPPNFPPAAPDQTLACQFYCPSRGIMDIQPTDQVPPPLDPYALWQPPLYLRVQKGSDLARGDIAEVAAGDGLYYRIRWVERVHLGFPNEYLTGLMEQISGTPAPLDGIQLEDGTYVLLEDGTFLLLE